MLLGIKKFSQHIVFLIFSFDTFALSQSDEQLIQKLQFYYTIPEQQLDFARIKLESDKVIDPSINVESSINQINQIVNIILKLSHNASQESKKLAALKKYLYEAGGWNQYRHYQYDFDDPLGTKLQNKLLPHYLKTRKGNCISMPILFFILADKLELNVSLSTAPLHVLVKYTDKQGNTYNIEPTSGGGITRNAWYKETRQITETAIQSGIYLSLLTKHESLTVITHVIAEHYFEQNEFDTVIALSNLSLKKYPKFVNVMLMAGTSFYRILHREFLIKYPHPSMIPINQRQRFQYLSSHNRNLFAYAEKLGWQEPPKDADKSYLNAIKNRRMR